MEFQARFPDEAACRSYLAASRWPEGFVCRRCGSHEAFELPRRNLWQCKSCGCQSSVTSGTVLHRSHKSLREWFWAAYLISTHTPGISALQLKRQLGLRRYETAWTMLQKLRRGMRRPDREALRDRVEVDETYLGNQEGLRGGRQLGIRALIVGAVEIRGKASGRIRLQVVPNASADSLTGFVKANVQANSIVVTDAWQGYASLARMGYRHRPKVQGEPERAGIILPRIHRVFGNLKTWLRGTHHGVEKKHLQPYLDEFVFRFNRRRTPMAGFQSLLGLSAVLRPTTRLALYE